MMHGCGVSLFRKSANQSSPGKWECVYRVTAWVKFHLLFKLFTIVVSTVIVEYQLLQYFRTALSGILPFGAMFIELFFILSVSLRFFVYGFLCLRFRILCTFVNFIYSLLQGVYSYWLVCRPLYHICYIFKPDPNYCDLIVVCSFIHDVVHNWTCMCLYPCCRFNGLMQLVFCFIFHFLNVAWKSPGNLLGCICRYPVMVCNSYVLSTSVFHSVTLWNIINGREKRHIFYIFKIYCKIALAAMKPSVTGTA